MLFSRIWAFLNPKLCGFCNASQVASGQNAVDDGTFKVRDVIYDVTPCQNCDVKLTREWRYIATCDVGPGQF